MPVKEAVVEAKSRLESKLPSNVAAYVKSKGGTTPISRVLIANNGIAAVKAMKSMRKWAYETFGNDREIEFIAMATPEDTAANAEYIRLADQCVTVPGTYYPP
jgi:acetyl-CoA carboxylase/biotin carboxylase 1